MRTFFVFLCFLAGGLFLYFNANTLQLPFLDVQLPNVAEANSNQSIDLDEAMDILSRANRTEPDLPGMERGHSYHEEKRREFFLGFRPQSNGSNRPYNWVEPWASLTNGDVPTIEAHWRSLNPETNDRKTSGRVLSAAMDPSGGDQIWIGTANSGIWHADTLFANWNPRMDSLPPFGISAIAVNPKDSNKLIAAIDSQTVRFASSPGLPEAIILASYDAGLSWNAPYELTPSERARTETTLHINHIAWHPADTNKVFLATNTGVWIRPAYDQRWINIANGEPFSLPTGVAQSVLIDPQNPQIITAGFKRLGIFRSTDGGTTWSELNDGAPSRVDYHLQNFSHSQGVYFASYLKWPHRNETLITKLSPNSAQWQHVFYDDQEHTLFAVSPVDTSLMYLGGIHLNRLHLSQDSTRLVLTPQFGLHANQHNLAFHPTNRNAILSINNGGVFTLRETPELDSWNPINGGLQNLQLYSISHHQTDTTILLIHAQDQGVHVRQPDMTWRTLLKGEGMGSMVQTDNADTTYIFSVEACGQLFQYYYPNTVPFDLKWGGGTETHLKGLAHHPAPMSCTQMPQAFWKPPFANAPDDGKYMYMATIAGIFRSDNRAQSWVLTSEVDSVSLLLVDPSSPMDVYAYKRSDGSFYSSNDRGVTWDRLSTTSVSDVHSLTVDPEQEGVLYAGRTEGLAQIIKSEDKGQTWTSISGNFSDLGLTILSISVTPRLQDGRQYVFIGTDLGLFVSDADDEQHTWYFIQGNLPYTMVMDIEYNRISQSVRVATFGRGVWQLDLPTNFLPPNPS